MNLYIYILYVYNLFMFVYFRHSRVMSENHTSSENKIVHNIENENLSIDISMDKRKQILMI
jgi:regulatory protein YycI of two-component signal transduction system YycFG